MKWLCARKRAPPFSGLAGKRRTDLVTFDINLPFDTSNGRPVSLIYKESDEKDVITGSAISKVKLLLVLLLH